MDIMSYEELEAILIEDEKNRQANPACINCIYYYEEYGYCNCKLHDMPPEELDIYNDKCPDWE